MAENMTETRHNRSSGNAQAAGGAARRHAEDTASMLERGAQVTGELSRQGGEAEARGLRQGGEMAGDLTRRATSAAAEGSRHIVEDTARHIEEVGREMAEAAEGIAEDIRLMLLPTSAEGGLHDVQRALGGLVEGVVHTNLRITQELFRRSNPGAIAQLQGRFIREYLDALVEGQTSIFRAVRRAADETLRPLERQQRQLAERRNCGGNGRREQHRGSRVADVMSRDVRVASPDDTVQQAARLMQEEDTGLLPVGENDRLVGMITDRDVAVRVAAEGKNPAQTRVREVMTPEVRYVFDDEDLHHIVDVMAEQQIRRLPVVNRNKRLVGVISLGDLAAEGGTPRLAGRALAGVAREGGRHRQSMT
jgi:CBS domain-containing protein